MNKVQILQGKHGRTFRVGEELPEDTYVNPAGMMAALVNDHIPEGTFILIRDHVIIEIIDARGEDSVVKLNVLEMKVDAIGLSEHDFHNNNEFLTNTRH